MKTANIPLYENIAVDKIIVLSVYKIDYTLLCLEYIRSVSSPLRRHLPLLRSRH